MSAAEPEDSYDPDDDYGWDYYDDDGGDYAGEGM